LDTINKIKDQQEFDYSINVECVPAERCAIILHQKDSLLFYPIDRPLYANQWIPLDEKCTFDEKIRLGALLDKKCGGGQIAHINFNDGFKNTDQAWKMLNKIAEKGVIYFAFNRKIYVCEDGHGFTGARCDICDKEATETYTRIVGFLTPTKSYSKERKNEYEKRYWFDMDD